MIAVGIVMRQGCPSRAIGATGAMAGIGPSKLVLDAPIAMDRG